MSIPQRPVGNLPLGKTFYSRKRRVHFFLDMIKRLRLMPDFAFLDAYDALFRRNGWLP